MEKEFPSKIFINLENKTNPELEKESIVDYSQLTEDTIKLHFKYPVDFSIIQNEVVSHTQKFKTDSLELENGNLMPIYFDEIPIRKRSKQKK